MHTRQLVGASSLALAVVLACAHTGEVELSVGDRAPDFALTGTDGEVHRLEDHLGERAVVIAWYPRAFTPG